MPTTDWDFTSCKPPPAMRKFPTAHAPLNRRKHRCALASVAAEAIDVWRARYDVTAHAWMSGATPLQLVRVAWYDRHDWWDSKVMLIETIARWSAFIIVLFVQTKPAVSLREFSPTLRCSPRRRMSWTSTSRCSPSSLTREARVSLQTTTSISTPDTSARARSPSVRTCTGERGPLALGRDLLPTWTRCSTRSTSRVTGGCLWTSTVHWKLVNTRRKLQLLLLRGEVKATLT